MYNKKISIFSTAKAGAVIKVKERGRKNSERKIISKII